MEQSKLAQLSRQFDSYQGTLAVAGSFTYVAEAPCVHGISNDCEWFTARVTRLIAQQWRRRSQGSETTGMHDWSLSIAPVPRLLGRQVCFAGAVTHARNLEEKRAISINLGALSPIFILSRSIPNSLHLPPRPVEHHRVSSNDSNSIIAVSRLVSLV